MLFIPAVTAFAEPVNTVLTYQLREDKVNYQFIITGEKPDFDVNLITPDGTKVTHDRVPTQEVEDYLYVGFDNERIWVVRNAAAGEYQFEIASAEEQRFRISTKDPIKKAETTWQSPKDEQLTIQETNARISLEWTVSGNVRPVTDRLYVWLQPEGGEALEIGDVPLMSGNATVTVPNHFPDGEYALLLTADTRTAEVQSIDPNVTITISRGGTASAELHQMFLDNGIVYADVKISRNMRWDEFCMVLWNKSGAAAGAESDAVEVTGFREEMERLEYEDRNVELWRWEATQLEEDGSYEGVLHIYDQGNPVTFLKIGPFEAKLRNWEEDTIAWSIDSEHTNRQFVDLSLQLQWDTEVQIVNEERVLFHDMIPQSEDGAPHTLQVQLTEGDQLIQVLLADEFGNFHTVSKRYLVDHTPPRLEMIQPLPKHTHAEGNFASGFVEPGAAITVNGESAAHDERGYFRVENIGASLTIEVADAAGNVTHYEWSKSNGSNPWVWIILGNVLILSLGAGSIFWMRHKWGRG